MWFHSNTQKLFTEEKIILKFIWKQKPSTSPNNIKQWKQSWRKQNVIILHYTLCCNNVIIKTASYQHVNICVNEWNGIKAPGTILWIYNQLNFDKWTNFLWKQWMVSSANDVWEIGFPHSEIWNKTSNSHATQNINS